MYVCIYIYIYTRYLYIYTDTYIFTHIYYECTSILLSASYMYIQFWVHQIHHAPCPAISEPRKALTGGPVLTSAPSEKASHRRSCADMTGT